jgi:hypothetical protein
LAAIYGLTASYGLAIILLTLQPFSAHARWFGFLPYLALVLVAVGLQYVQLAQTKRRSPATAQANPQMRTVQSFLPILRPLRSKHDGWLPGQVGFAEWSASLSGTESKAMKLADTLSFLLGQWTLERFLTDHRSGTDGRFEGSATINRSSSGQSAGFGTRAHYEEVGTMHFGRHVGPASRSLELVRLESTIVMLYFPDGKPFVDLDLRSGTWRSTHPCGEDVYEILTVVRSPSEFEEHWRVHGPTEDYDAVATLRRSD